MKTALTKVSPPITALLAGLLFGAGLSISGMTDTSKVLGFLDIFGIWDASLMFVMGAALAVTIPAFMWIKKRDKPLLDSCFYLPGNNSIDGRLLAGSAIFGTGWGLYGYCPGPAIAALSSLHSDSLIFILCMLLGMFLASKIAQG